MLPTTRLRLPFLRAPCFVEGGEVRYAHRAERGLSPADVELVQTVLTGGATVDDLARRLVERGAADDVQETADRLFESFRRPESNIGVVEVEVPARADVILIEQGYGGVYVHSVELFKKLKRRWSCLLLSSTDPLFENEPLDDVITLQSLQARHPDLSYFAWVQLVRTITKRTECRLLMLMHRSQSLMLFDLLRERRTVIYCDGFYDAAYRRVHDFRLDETPDNRRKVLSELHYLLANSNPRFFGVNSTPAVNVKLLMAGGYSLTSSIENWCWGAEQRDHMVAAFPHLESSIKLMLPFTDAALFSPQSVQRERRILFTTTMHNIDRKGLPELVRAMGRLRSLRTRCVVRQPEHLPPIPAAIARRMEIGKVTRTQMVELYHRLWLNCRTSRDESSPMSILESMTCELPQIVSPAVARQIPIIEDGATGFVVDPDDGDRLVWALKTLLEDRRLRDRMGRECRRRAVELSFENRVHEFERVIA